MGFHAHYLEGMPKLHIFQDDLVDLDGEVEKGVPI